MTSEQRIKDITYRFVVKTADGSKNFLSVVEKPNGDVHIAERGKHGSYDFVADALLGEVDSQGERFSRVITIHPSLYFDDNRITVNYKTITNGTETERVAVAALEIKDGLAFFPVLCSIGSNIGTTSLDLPAGKKAKDIRVLLWPNQQFDWTLQSVGYAFFACNTELSYVFPKGFPYIPQLLKFKHFQLLFLYWAVDKPTKGVNFYQVPEYQEGISSGLDFRGVMSFIQALQKKHMELYDSLPEFHPGQLPAHPIAHQGIPVVDPRIYFKRPVYRILTDRDASLMRISFQDASGAHVVIDLNGKSITEFRDAVAHAILVVPGVAEWGEPLEPLDVLSDRQRPHDPPPESYGNE